MTDYDRANAVCKRLREIGRRESFAVDPSQWFRMLDGQLVMIHFDKKEEIFFFNPKAKCKRIMRIVLKKSK